MGPIMKKKRRAIRLEAKVCASSDSWSSLPSDILCLVAEKIEFLGDYVSFCFVCRYWYILGTELYSGKRKFDFETPFYVFGINPDHDLRHFSAIFPKNPKFDPNVTFRSYGLKRNFAVDLPEASGRRCWGSPFGWLVTYGAVDLEFSLLNPFTKATIALPSMRTLFPADFNYDPPGSFIKAFLAVDPTRAPRDCKDGCVVILVVRLGFPPKKCILAFARPGRDQVWTRFPGGRDMGDIVSFRGRLYGVAATCYSTVSVYTIQTRPLPRIIKLVRTTPIARDPNLGLPGRDREVDRYDCRARKYLIELNNELCVVLRYTTNKSNTSYFKVFSVDLSTGNLTRVLSLGGHCLFLGNNYTFAYKATSPPPEDFKQLEHPPDDLMSNHVYYTYDDDWLLYTRKVRPFFPDEGVWEMLRSNKVYNNKNTLTKYPPFWIVPSITFPKLEQL